MLILRSAWPTSVSVFCWPSTTAALFSARSTTGSSWSISTCIEAGACGTPPEPSFRPRRLRASASALSFSSGNAVWLPSSACETDFASRCDCVCACPAAPTSAALRELDTTAAMPAITMPTRPMPNRLSSSRCWRATGQAPISGSPLPAGPAASEGIRVSLKSAASSDGAASEMIDESAPLREAASWGGASVPGPRRIVASIGFAGCASSS